jgi:hypothetical protein
MEKSLSPASLRLDLPPNENAILEALQLALKDHLKINYVSKASTIRFLIRNGSIPTTSEQTNSQ